MELTDSVINVICFIKDINIAFLLKYAKNNGYRVRMRSNSLGVIKFAKRNGDRGHRDVVEFTIDVESGQEAKEIFIKELKGWLEQYSG